MSTLSGFHSRASGLADQLRQAILDSGLKPGQTFMTEDEVCHRFEVSRNVAREAIGRVRGLGLLTSRRNRGLVVQRPDPASLVEKSIPMLLRDETNVQQLAWCRYALLMGSIDLAVLNATEEQIQELRDLAAEWDRCVRDDALVDQGFDTASRINSLILRMANVDLLKGYDGVIEAYFQRTRWRADLGWPKDMLDRAWWYHELAEAIAHRDAEQARAMLRMHLGYLLRPKASPLKHTAGHTPPPPDKE